MNFLKFTIGGLIIMTISWSVIAVPYAVITGTPLSPFSIFCWGAAAAYTTAFIVGSGKDSKE